MAISSGEEPSTNNNSRIRKRPRITIPYRSRVRGTTEVLGWSRENDEEGRERQNEDTEEEEAEDVDAEEEALGVYADEPCGYHHHHCGEEIASGVDNAGSGAIDESISVSLTDPDILDCCICCQPLDIPVLQCENGHIACSTCCVRLAHKCYSCQSPIVHIRCRAIEKVLESIKISCCYARHRCIEKVTHINKSVHEQDCIYTPYRCPIDGCHFTAPSKKLSQHINHEHNGSFMNFYYDSFLYLMLELNQKVIVLKELTDSNIFIITNDLEHLGNVIKVSHVGPKSSAKMYRYDLYARSQRSCLKLESCQPYSW